MAITVADADAYFSNSVLFNNEWTNADADTKLRALNNASNQLYRHYKKYSPNDPTGQKKPIPDEAIFEQTMWLLRLNETVRQAEQGVKEVIVSGIRVQLDSVNNYICPEVIQILGRKVGRYGTRLGYGDIHDWFRRNTVQEGIVRDGSFDDSGKPNGGNV